MKLNFFKNDLIVHALENKTNFIANLTLFEEALYFANVKNNKPIIIVKPNLYQAQKLYKQLYILCKEDVVLFQADESLRFEAIASSPEMGASQIENLARFIDNPPKIIVTHLPAYLRYLPNPDVFKQYIFNLEINQKITKKQLEQLLITAGYRKTTRIEHPLCFASRGGIIDIFSINYDQPIRIEFFDTEIESIRFFDIATQRTVQTIHNVTILPATTILFSETQLEEIRNNLPKNMNAELQAVMESDYDFLTQHATDSKLQRFMFFTNQKYSIFDYIQADTYFSTKEEITIALEQLELDTAEFLYELSQFNQFPAHTQHYFDFSELDNGYYLYQFHPNALTSTIKQLNYTPKKEEVLFEIEKKAKNQQVIVCVNKYQKEILASKLPSSVQLLELPLTQGFSYENIDIYSAKEIFNQQVNVVIKNNKFQNATILNTYQDLAINDYVVHAKYGIGKYLGIQTKIINNIHRDYLEIEYENNDKLFIPVEQFQLVRKFLSKDAIHVKLSAIGTKKWSSAKEKIQKGIEELAERLIELYSIRSEKNGFVYAEDDEFQKAFEADFPYELTPDQKRSVAEIKAEMQSSGVMDRLLCGDVGFGKTEVAAIASFKAVNNGKQVAYLCPTTILANQHYQTFKKRFKNFPVRIAMLSRFVSKKEATQVVEDLKNGEIDILIGTHRILSKDVVFKNLGFLIIDEEQRFGVIQKEKIKELKNTLDVLSLSATPIPRTLQMSLVGIRSLSQLDTPPKNRFSVQTYILESNDNVIKNIIERELARNGQVFYLFNDTNKIYHIADKLTQLIPNCSVGVAHGKMTKTEIENVMLKFINNEFNVLVCTTIIETGIDIPNANTIIIDKADHFGLSQLYQIKGRVGRGDRLAYAYLMYDKGKVLTEEASARLEAIKEFTQLGSGYRIALRDLSIRGAGDLLGGKQAGFIDTVGMDMYIDMLNNAIERKRGILAELPTLKSTNLKVDAYIPEEFSNDDMEKLQLYQRLDKIQTLEQYREFLLEIKDNFGKLPKEVQLLFEKKRFDILISSPYIDDFSENTSHISVTFNAVYSSKIKGEDLFLLTDSFKNEIKISYTNKQITISMQKFKDYLIHFINLIEDCLTLTT